MLNVDEKFKELALTGDIIGLKIFLKNYNPSQKARGDALAHLVCFQKSVSAQEKERDEILEFNSVSIGFFIYCFPKIIDYRALIDLIKNDVNTDKETYAEAKKHINEMISIRKSKIANNIKDTFQGWNIPGSAKSNVRMASQIVGFSYQKLLLGLSQKQK